MVTASRKEAPAPVDVRAGVRVELENTLRSPKNRREQETDWTGALIGLFSPGFVKLGVAAAFACMLALDLATTLDNTESETNYNDPLVTLYSGEGEWSDLL